MVLVISPGWASVRIVTCTRCVPGGVDGSGGGFGGDGGGRGWAELTYSAKRFGWPQAC